MIRHIVFFTLKPEVTEADREWLFAKMKSVVAEIPVAKRFAIGKQLVPSEEWYKSRLATDFLWAITVEFESEADLYKYQKDPKHEALITELSKRISERKVYDLVV